MSDQEKRDLPVAGFTPIDIFAPPPVRLRPARPFSAHRRYRLKPAPVQIPAAERKTMPGLPPAEEPDALFFFAAAGLWIVTWLFALLGRLIPQALEHPGRASSFIYYILILLLPVARRAMRSGAAAEKMRLRRPARGTGVLGLGMGLASAAAGMGLMSLWRYALTAMGAELPAGLQVGPEAIPGLMITSALLPAVCEEWFFRGYLLSAWEDRRGWGCVPVTAVLFALIHSSVQGLPAQLAMGLVLGAVCVRSGSVFVPVLAHFGYNAGMLLFSGLWSGGWWARDAALLFFGAAVALVFYGLICRLSGGHEANSPLGRSVGWEGAAALYAGVATCVVALAADALRIFGVLG